MIPGRAASRQEAFEYVSNDVGVHRYLGMRAFARTKRVQYQYLSRWRLDGPVWVPPPVVRIGQRVGWPLPLIQVWTPTVRAGDGPVPKDWVWPQPTIECADTARMCRAYALTAPQLWDRIADGDIPAPQFWVDSTPGWPLIDGSAP